MLNFPSHLNKHLFQTLLGKEMFDDLDSDIVYLKQAEDIPKAIRALNVYFPHLNWYVYDQEDNSITCETK